AALMYSMYGPLADGDHQRLNSLLKFARAMFRWIAGLVVVAGFVVYPFLDDLIGDRIPDPYVGVYFLILLAGLASKYLLMPRALLLIADQRMYVVKTYNFIAQSVRSVLQIVALVVLESF